MKFDHRRGFSVYPDAEPGSIPSKAPYIDYGTDRIDPARYIDTAEADREWEHMWTKSWQFAGLVHDIPHVGDYFKVDIGRESFLVVRTGEGPADIAAYYNVCPHRGNRIVHSDFGSAGLDNCFRCDFHGWRFGVDGKNVEIRDEVIFRPEAIAHRPGLKTVHCEIWNSFVFISMADAPGPLSEHLDVIPAHLVAYPFDKYRVLKDIEVCWDANWKTALDAFVEFYHADDVHPEVIPVTETLECQYDLYQRGISRMIIPVGFVTSRFEDRDTVNDYLKGFVQFYGGDIAAHASVKGRDYKKVLVQAKRAWARRHGYDHFANLSDDQVTDDWNYFIFPNVTINVFSDSLLIQIFRPHPTDAQKSYYRAISLCLPVGGTEEMVMDPASFGPEAISEPGWDGAVRPPIVTPKHLSEFGAVLGQDARRVPEVQKGMQSRAYAGYVLSESEIRIRHYLAELDRYLGRS